MGEFDGDANAYEHDMASYRRMAAKGDERAQAIVEWDGRRKRAAKEADRG